MARQTRNWAAIQTTNLIGSEYHLTVTGEVQTLKTNEKPHLAEARPQGINPTELILVLDITASEEIGGDVVQWRPVEFRKTISPGQYHSVMIRQGDHTETVEVEQVPS